MFCNETFIKDLQHSQQLYKAEIWSAAASIVLNERLFQVMRCPVCISELSYVYQLLFIDKHNKL